MKSFAEAFEVMVALAKASEGCVLRAYPDPASPLSRALVRAGVLRAYLRGQYVLTEEQRKLSGAPWTIGYGETQGIREGMEWTQEHAEAVLRTRLMSFLVRTMKKCPALYLEPPIRAVACGDMAYNVGVGAFGASSVCRNTMRRAYQAAADSFLLWNKAGGRVMRGLTIRCQKRRALYLSA